MFVHASRMTGAAFKARGRTVDLRSDPARLEYMKRFDMAEMFSYILIAGAGIRLGCRSSAKHDGFVAPVVRLACEFSKVVNALLNSRLGTHFVSSQLKCLVPIRRHGFAMHLGGDRQTCACGYSAGAGRSTCVQTALPGAYETIRHGRECFHAPHRGSRHWSGLPLISKTWSFAQQVLAWRPHRYGNRSRSGAGGDRGASRLALRPIGTS